MFTTGIYLDNTVFDQTRILDSQRSNNLTKFYPNIIVTPQVFKLLETNKYDSKVVYGGFGIGKTFSIIYYKILLEYVSKFWM